jgi:Lon protease-like protein
MKFSPPQVAHIVEALLDRVKPCIHVHNQQAEHSGIDYHWYAKCLVKLYVRHALSPYYSRPFGHNISMASRLIPLFPLQVVVFPRTPLPLHIFEERYKEMTGNAIREHSDIGIVLAKEEGIVNAGCTVRIEKLLHTYPDGRMDLLTRGQDRFEIRELNHEKSYLQATVEFFDDDDVGVVPAELRDRALANYNALRELTSLDDRAPADLDDPQVSFQLAQILPDLDFLHSLQRQRSETGRLKQLNQYLAPYIPRQRTIERVKAVAPTNGFGGKHAGL